MYCSALDNAGKIVVVGNSKETFKPVPGWNDLGEGVSL